jgi:hypothetical protein
MVSLRFSSSRSSSISSLSQSYKDALSSLSGPGSVGGSASSSKESLSKDDEGKHFGLSQCGMIGTIKSLENDTITTNRLAQLVPKLKENDVQKTDECALTLGELEDFLTCLVSPAHAVNCVCLPSRQI